MSAVVFRSGSREDFDDVIAMDDVDQSTLYFMNTNGDFDPHGMCDDGDLYLGGALIGVSRAEKAQIDASIAALENANSMTTDASVWFIGADSSSMTGWNVDNTGSGKRYIKDVSLGDFINSDKLQFNAMLMIENTMNAGSIIAEIYIEMGHYEQSGGIGRPSWILSAIPAGNPFGTQVHVPYIATKSSDKGFTTANLSGLMIGPFPSNNIIRIVVSVPAGVYLTIRDSTPESYITNASQLIVQKFGNGS